MGVADVTGGVAGLWLGALELELEGNLLALICLFHFRDLNFVHKVSLNGSESTSMMSCSIFRRFVP